MVYTIKRIKSIFPKADIDLLSYPILGLVNFSTLQLMNHLHARLVNASTYPVVMVLVLVQKQ